MRVLESERWPRPRPQGRGNGHRHEGYDKNGNQALRRSHHARHNDTRATDTSRRRWIGVRAELDAGRLDPTSCYATSAARAGSRRTGRRPPKRCSTAPHPCPRRCPRRRARSGSASARSCCRAPRGTAPPGAPWRWQRSRPPSLGEHLTQGQLSTKLRPAKSGCHAHSTHCG